MMADVMFNKKQYTDAIFHYEKLLEAKPDHFEVKEPQWAVADQWVEVPRLGPHWPDFFYPP